MIFEAQGVEIGGKIDLWQIWCLNHVEAEGMIKAQDLPQICCFWHCLVQIVISLSYIHTFNIKNLQFNPLKIHGKLNQNSQAIVTAFRNMLTATCMRNQVLHFVLFYSDLTVRFVRWMEMVALSNSDLSHVCQIFWVLRFLLVQTSWQCHDSYMCYRIFECYPFCWWYSESSQCHNTTFSCSSNQWWCSCPRC